MNYDYLPPFTSAKPCPRCKELLHWSQNERPPKVDFDTRTGFVLYVELMRFCLSCGFKEIGVVNINKKPAWTEVKENG